MSQYDACSMSSIVKLLNKRFLISDFLFHYLNQWWLVYWRIYASLRLNELTHWPLVISYGNKNLVSIGHHYLNQCWLIISEALWHSPEGNFTGNTVLDTSSKVTNLRLQPHLPHMNELYPLYTGAFVPPLYDHITGQVAVEGRTAEPRRSVAHRSLKGGRRKVHASPWSQNGRTVVGHRSPRKYAYCCEHYVSIWATLLPSLYHHCASFGRPVASIERSLWRPLCLHSASTATLEPPWQWFCLHSASFVRPDVPLQQLWSFKEGTRVVLQQLHRNRTFWVRATTERPDHFSGRSKRWHEGRSPV